MLLFLPLGERKETGAIYLFGLKGRGRGPSLSFSWGKRKGGGRGPVFFPAFMSRNGPACLSTFRRGKRGGGGICCCVATWKPFRLAREKKGAVSSAGRSGERGRFPSCAYCPEKKREKKKLAGRVSRVVDDSIIYHRGGREGRNFSRWWVKSLSSFSALRGGKTLIVVS